MALKSLCSSTEYFEERLWTSKSRPQVNSQELERSVLDGFCCRKRPSWSDNWTEVVVAHFDDRSVEHVRVQERFRPKRCLVDCKVCLQVHAVSLAEAESRGKMQMTTAGCAQRVKSKMAPVSSLQSPEIPAGRSFRFGQLSAIRLHHIHQQMLK